jgi:hypothetical protein
VSLAETGEESGQEGPEVGEAALGFHVANLGLDGAATPEELAQSGREAAPCAADEHPRALRAVSAIAAVNHGEAGAVIGQGLDLLASGRVCPS